jgi:hypothetical protein
MRGMTGADLLGEMNERDRIAELAAIIGSGEAALFTGAGFSAEAQDCAGRALPDTKEMIAELWQLLFEGAPPDESTLADLYDVALFEAPDLLRSYLATRLRIGDAPLPPTFARWFSAPWRRIYTLNVDDLEVAVSRQFSLPRPLVSISALGRERGPIRNDGLEVIHLNGIAGDDPRQVTFSTMQYAARLCTPDREYERLVHDLGTLPFVFVGTTLDEVVLWQHIELERRHNGGQPPRRHSFLISPSLSRARHRLLESYRIHWLPATACEIAEQVLARL